MEKVVVAAECSSRIEAEIIQSLLQSAGITSHVTADDAGGMYQFKFSLSSGGIAKVLVKESDLLAAQQIIASTPTP